MKTILAAGALAALVIGAGIYLTLPGLLNSPAKELSFRFESSSAVHNPGTGLTNVTLNIRNTGMVPLRLGGEGGIAPPQRYQYVAGSFQARFYGPDGVQLFGGGGTPPDTSNGGLLIATYLIGNARAGDTFTINTTLTWNGDAYSQSVSLEVIDCAPGAGGCFTGSSSTSSSSTATSSTPTTATSLISTPTSWTSSSTTTSASTKQTPTSTSGTTTSTSTPPFITSTTTTGTASSSGTTTSGTVAWRFVNATASRNNATGVTSITVWVQDTGTISFGPAGTNPLKTPSAVPNGTAYVSGSWMAYFYNSKGTFLCSSPCGGPPDTANGGWIRVTIAVTGADVGNELSLTYTIDWAGQVAGPQSITFRVG